MGVDLSSRICAKTIANDSGYMTFVILHLSYAFWY
jgi:hypothetical protein